LWRLKRKSGFILDLLNQHFSDPDVLSLRLIFYTWLQADRLELALEMKDTLSQLENNCQLSPSSLFPVALFYKVEMHFVLSWGFEREFKKWFSGKGKLMIMARKWLW